MLVVSAALACATAAPRQNPVGVVQREVEGNAVLDHEIITGRGPERPDPWDVGWVRNVVEDGFITRVELP